jgi:tetratricopeptide (TPR) repeat protein
MAKKQKNTQRVSPPPVSSSTIVATDVKPIARAPKSNNKLLLQIVLLATISLIIWLTWQDSLQNKFTNWDDLGYVLTNPLIKDPTNEGLKRLFHLDSHVMGNYHPLTILTYWLEYSKHGLEPYIYHLDSVLYHIVTTITAYIFSKCLTRSTLAAFVAALLFAIHPLRTESVTWIAGRKDVLYSMFYLLACTTHLLYIRKNDKKTIWYVATIVLFTLSLMCKSVGVTLPVVLLILDYYERRDLKLNLILEKLPLFALALLFGYFSTLAQKQVGALGTLDVHFSWYEKIAIACYSLTTYTWKLLLPIGLTNFYPYPMKVNDALPSAFYLYILVVGGIFFAIWKWGRNNRGLVLGVSFFVVNLLLLLQIIPVGGAVMSDRYTYLPYLGLFLIIGLTVAKFVDAKPTVGKLLLGLVLLASAGYAWGTKERNKDWYDSVSLWSDAIEKNPESPIAYFYLGQEYFTRFESAVTPSERKMNGDSAFHYFNLSIAHKPDYTNPIVCLGEYYRSIGLIDEAKMTYQKVLAIKDDLESAYLGLGVIFAIKNQFDSSGIMFRKALSLKDFNPEGHSNYANYLEITGKTDSALKEYEKSLSQNPDAYIPYMNRAKIYLRLNKWELALADYTKAIALKPENPDPYLQRAQCYLAIGDKVKARQDVETAKRLGAIADPLLLDKLK